MLDDIFYTPNNKKIENKLIVHELDKGQKEKFKEVELYPLSDLHVGNRYSDIDHFRKFLEFILEKPNRFIIFNGDNANNAIKSGVSNVYHETMPPSKQKKFLIGELKCVKDRILCFVEGNHEARSTKDVDQSIVEDIATALGKEELYREDEAFLKLCFGTGNTSTNRQCYTAYVTHGAGGGKRAGSGLNNLELLALSADADMYIIGHGHKAIAHKNVIRKIDTRNNVINETLRMFVMSSSWQGFGGYASKKMLIPSAQGSVPIILSGKEKKMISVI
jgi:predicted MPP superfamily phosphohydrolase